jgi:hypothetical protein
MDYLHCLIFEIFYVAGLTFYESAKSDEFSCSLKTIERYFSPIELSTRFRISLTRISRGAILLLIRANMYEERARLV